MLLKKNAEIIAEVRRRIAELGLGSRLALEPIENTFKCRRQYAKSKDGIFKFSVLMWQINKLDDQELSDAINDHIAKAIKHFDL